MKRGAEIQLTKEGGDVEPEARLANPDDTYSSLIFPTPYSQRQIQVSKKHPTKF